VTLAEQAPTPRTGTSPILFAASGAANALAEGLSAIADFQGDIDLNEALGQLAALNGVTISQLPTRAAPLRHTAPPQVEVAVAEAAPEAPAAATGITLPQIGVETPAPTPHTSTAPITTPPVAVAPAAQDAPTAPATAAPTQQDTALSIDVLRAMQSALSRAQKRKVQLSLRNLHFYRGLIDGIFGRQSAHAISAYQESIGASVTGVLTPTQLQTLIE